MRTWKSICCFLTTCLMIATASGAQEQDKARIFGTVTDKKHAAVPDATIKIIPHCKCSDCAIPERCDCCPDQFTVMTDKQGHFEVDVKPGSYSLETHSKKLDVEVHRKEVKNVNIVVEPRADK